MDYVTRGVCGQEGCRERRYYLDNGLWFCRRGHLQEGRQVEEDPDDFGTQGKTHRVKKEKEGKSRKTYRGQPAYTLYLQAYQLILWKQCHALVQNHGFPEQFEGVVRDLWALRLQKFKLRINDTTDDEDDGDHAPELFSSQPSQTEESDDEHFKSRSSVLKWPHLLDAVALCYLAAILMRLPVCVNDFHRLIIRQEIPYIRSMRSLPAEMKNKLPPEFVARLDVNRLPKIENLHRGFLNIALYYQQRFGIILPPLNSTLVLYRHIKRLAIPIDVYEATGKLQELLAFTYEFPKRLRKDERKISFHLPEVQLMVVLVIATKLLFPFDGITRYPTTTKEPSTQAMNWEAWMGAQRHFADQIHRNGKIGTEEAIQLTDKDVLDMKPNQLDEYMDWYEKNWLDTSKDTPAIAKMFPISRAESETAANSDHTPTSGPEDDPMEAALTSLLQTALQEILPTEVIPSRGEEEDLEEGLARPGDWYQRYRWESALPITARTFYELAAQLAGISLQTLIRAVSIAEFRIAKWHENQRRSEYLAQFGVDLGDEAGDAMDVINEQLSELGDEDEAS
ncbi:hypothetical protein N7492_000928 [Penicillium capsulatum]|uniref:RRN7-type domain-containing protein n=1 Tax=Penicillium capsulatum TaxID=69766 RepID=A0A9W9ISU5_9EURO|nr:hypothetical protein N7492_000928 [Penicillium capsulatum]KAJ6130014.1 hypothetical protein N7512_002794 [Penicillium capsulatum]